MIGNNPRWQTSVIAKTVADFQLSRFLVSRFFLGLGARATMLYTFLVILLCLSAVALAFISCTRYLQQQQRHEASTSNRKVKVWLNTLGDGQSALKNVHVILRLMLIKQQITHDGQRRAARREVQSSNEEHPSERTSKSEGH